MWIDGKPIYRKAFSGTGKNIIGNITGYDSIVNIDGVVKDDTNWLCISYSGTYNVNVRIESDGAVFLNYNGNITQHRIWVEYTKTID